MLLVSLAWALLADDPYRKIDEAIAKEGLFWDLIAK